MSRPRLAYFFDESGTARVLEYCTDGIGLRRRRYSTATAPDRNSGRKLQPYCHRKVSVFDKSRSKCCSDFDSEMILTPKLDGA